MQDGFNTPDDCVREGYAAKRRNEYARAAELLERALALGKPKNPKSQVMTVIGDCYDELGKYAVAIDWYEKALAEDPRWQDAWTSMGISYRRLGNYAEAERCYLQSLSLNPDNAVLQASIGALHIFRGDGKKALPPLERAMALDPNMAIAFGSYAQALAMTGRFDDAEEALKRAIILGHQNHAVIRERIDALRKI